MGFTSVSFLLDSAVDEDQKLTVELMNKLYFSKKIVEKWSGCLKLRHTIGKNGMKIYR